MNNYQSYNTDRNISFAKNNQENSLNQSINNNILRSEQKQQEQQQYRRENKSLSKFSVSPQLLKQNNNAEFIQIIEKQKDQVFRLEEKLLNKEKLLTQMRSFHSDLCCALEETQEELAKQQQQNQEGIRVQDTTANAMNRTIALLQNKEYGLQKENEELKRGFREKVQMIEDFKKQEKIVQKNHESLVFQLETTIKKLEVENIDQQKEIQELITQQLSMEKEILILKNKNNDKQNNQYGNILNEQVSEGQRKLKNEQQQKLLIKIQFLESEIKQLTKENLKFQEQIRIQNQNDYNNQNNKWDKNSHLRSKSVHQNDTQYSSRIQVTTNTYRDRENSSFQQQLNDRIVFDLLQVLQIEKKQQIIESVQEIQKNSKQAQRFLNCITEMTTKIAPVGYFNQKSKPTLKQIWKFLKMIIEEYLFLLKYKAAAQCQNDNSLIKQDILQYINSNISEQNYNNDLVSKLITIFCEHQLMEKIINNIKQILNMEWINDLAEFEKTLQIQLNKLISQQKHFR